MRRTTRSGYGGRSGFDRRTWLYDPDAMTFAQVATATIPPGRVDPATAYDPARGRISNYAWGIDYHEAMTPRLERQKLSIDDLDGVLALRRELFEIDTLEVRQQAAHALVSRLGMRHDHVLVARMKVGQRLG